MQDKDNSYNSVSFGRRAEGDVHTTTESKAKVDVPLDTQTQKKTRPLDVGRKKKRSLAEFVKYDEEISIGDAMGDAGTLPQVISRAPKFIQFLWKLFFGNIDIKEKKVIPRTSAGVDRVMVVLICVLVSIGSVMVFSASYAFAQTRYGDSLHFVKKQIMFVLIGLVVMFLTSIFTPAFYKMLTRGVYAVALLLLVLVLVMGFAGNGAQRWISLGPLSFQPSEVAKMALVLILAWYYSVFEDRVINYANRRQTFFYGIFYPFMFIGLTAGLVMLEKHLSCLIILGCIGLIMMFAAGSDKKLLGLICGVGIAAVGAMAVIIPYTRRRLIIWLDPAKDALDGGWQTLNGLNAIGSGGFFGLGLGNSRMKYSYVSEPANDFIFTITCEELGFVGAAAIFILFAMFVYRGYLIARTNHDTFARLTAFGITTQVAVQALLNFAVVTNTFPNTGIALPFFSYGGTSLVMLFAEMGILLSVSRSSHLKYR
jgi:cell division protein FtsW